MTTLEEILKKYFHCPLSFEQDGRLTSDCDKGIMALIELLYDLEDIGVFENANEAEDKIWSIIEQDNLPLARTYCQNIKDAISGNPEYKLTDLFQATCRNGSTITFKYLIIDDSGEVQCIVGGEGDTNEYVALSDLDIDSLQDLYGFILDIEVNH